MPTSSTSAGPQPANPPPPPTPPMGLLHDPVAGALNIPYIERPVPFAGPTSPPVTAAAIAIWPPAATSP
eukprot:13250874-Alexandrium_andersonii.AAC.1